jgi:alpha-ketoglutarate-dependent taurine dioxygenase
MNKTENDMTSLRESRAAKRKAFKPQSINVSEEALVSTEAYAAGMLPLIVRPNIAGVDLHAWASHHREFIERKLLEYGSLLFRGFNLREPLDFDRFLTAIELPRMHYMEGATPRIELSEKVYTSTEYPSNQTIALHNELNYVITWPMKIFFFCVVAAETGGETPIADVRKVYQRLDPKIRQRFSEKGWMLVRNFGEHMSLPWQTAFRLTEKSELESYCRQAHIEFEWNGDDLRTRQVRPAVRQHPRTGEWVWFNHVAFWHISSLAPSVRRMFLAEYAPEELPYNTYYGDGSHIEDAVVEELREAYRQETVAFRWEEGDLLMIDNMLVAHGRHPFTGQRKILTAMGEPCHNGQLENS